MMDDDLKRRQAATARLEQRMRDFLVGFDPAEKLTVGDMKVIARFSANFAFDEFSKPE